MGYIAFFSYAREDLDPYLRQFFTDLSTEIAALAGLARDDETVSFQDKKSLRVMENWKSDIEEALQSAAVLVCFISRAYLNKEFCGKEYYLFNQRRRRGLAAGEKPRPIVLPVIWIPVGQNMPEFLNEPQQLPAGVDDRYREVGLRRITRFKEKESGYDQCVTAFADAIFAASEQYPAPPLDPAAAMDFDQIPNAFAGGDWQEAADARGWIPGPEVANFVFAAGLQNESPLPEGRYGASESAWRPYLPPEPTTILEHAKTIANKRSLKFRALSVNDNLTNEMTAAKARKNLMVVVADPRASAARLQRVRAIEDLWWEGSAVVLPCDATVPKDVTTNFPQSLKAAFPVLSQATARIRVADSSLELQTTLGDTLSELRAAVTKSETDKKDKTDAPPANVRAAGATE